jgi:hypothetical protein
LKIGEIASQLSFEAYFSVRQFPAYRLLPCIHKSLINTFLPH